MKQQLPSLTCAFFTLLSVTAAAQVPNGDFEEWVDNGGGFLDPQGWLTSNADISLLSVEQYTPAWSNNLAMRVRTWDSGFGVFQGTAMAMFPYSQRPTGLNAAVMANVVPGDRVLIILSMWQGDSVIAMPLNCTFGIDTSIAAWTTVTFPITYSSSLYPDSCSIIVMAGSAEPQVGTEVMIDDLSFDFSTGSGGPAAASVNVGLQAYPDPASDRVRIRIPLKGGEDVRFLLYAMDGRLVRSQRYGHLMGSERTLDLDVDELTSGVYQYQVLINGRPWSGRLVVEH